jgi:tetratricopeptide (TPR) repeat protein
MVRSRWLVSLVLLGLATVSSVALAAYRFYTTRTAYLLARGQAALERGDWDGARNVIQVLEQKTPPSVGRLFRGKYWTYVGRAALPDGGEPDVRAQEAFRRALGELSRLRDEGRLGQEGTVLGAECLVRLGETRLATGALTTLVRQQPDLLEAHRWLAAIYIDLNSPFDAVEQLKEWARLDPTAGRPYRWIGFFFKDYNRPNEAITAYQEACRRDLTATERTAVLQELTETLLSTRADYQAALDRLQQGPEDFQEQPPIRVLRAECLWGLGRTSEAVAEVEGALEQSPTLPQALRWRAKMYLADRQPRAALPLLEKAARIEFGDLETRQYLMQAYGHLGDKVRAEEQRQRVEEIKGYKDRLTKLHEEAQRNRWDDGVRLRIAELCQHLNRPAEARMWLRAALACNPHNPEARQQLAQLPWSDGN